MKTKDMLGCFAWAASFLLVTAWIPFVGPFISLLTPLPFLYYSTKLGLYRGIVLAALVTLTIGVISKLIGIPQGILFCVEFGLLGLVLSELFRRKLTIGTTVLLAGGFMLLMGFVFLYFMALSKNMGPFELMQNYLRSHLIETLELYEGINIDQEKAIDLQGYGKILVDTISRIYISMMVIGAGLIVWINVIIGRLLLRMGKLAYPHFVPMDRWNTPDYLIWGVIGSGFALFLPSSSIKLLAINLLIVLLAIYIFHGVSIVLFFLNKFKVPTWLRVGIYLLIMLQQIFLVALALAGLFDQWVDFRKIHRKMENKSRS